MGGFIAEARGTCQTANSAVVSQCVTGSLGPPWTQPSQASSASGESKSKNPLFKLQRYDRSACLETFLLQFKHLAKYLQWGEDDCFYHVCQLRRTCWTSSLEAADECDGSRLRTSAPDEVWYAASSGKL